MTITNEEVAKAYAFAKILGCELSLKDFQKQFADLSKETFKELSKENAKAKIKPIKLY